MASNLITSPALLALIGAARQAEVEAERHHADVYEPAVAASDEAISAVPHITFESGPDVLGNQIVYSTSNRVTMATTRAIITMAKEGKLSNPPAVADARKIVAADIRRQRSIGSIRRAAGLPQIVEDSDALNERVSNLQQQVAVFPANTPGDLVAKLAFMIERDMGAGMDWLDELHVDARRLAMVEG